MRGCGSTPAKNKSKKITSEREMGLNFAVNVDLKNCVTDPNHPDYIINTGKQTSCVLGPTQCSYSDRQTTLQWNLCFLNTSLNLLLPRVPKTQISRQIANSMS